MKNSVNNTLNWKINSQLSQVVMIPRHFEYVFTDRIVLLHLTAIELVGDFISLNSGISLKYQLQLLEHLICSVAFKKLLKSRFQAVKHGTLNYRVVIRSSLPGVHNICISSCSRSVT